MLVDVWVARHRQDGDRGYDDPVRVASDVAVGERATRHGALGSASTTAVQVLVEGDVVPQLIHAVDDEDRVTLVPVPTTGGRDS
jgi:sulfur carrier protein ThiS